MATPVITDGLVANWEFKTFTSGTQWVDSVSGLVISFSSAPSKSGVGIELNAGVTFQASISSLGLSQPVSIEWIGRIDAGSFGNNMAAHVFGLGPDVGGWDNSICCYSNGSSNGVQLDLDSSGTVTSGMNSAGMYHIVVRVSDHSWVATSTCDLYVNNTTQHHYQESNLISRNQAIQSDKNYLYNNEGTNRFIGAVDAIRIWNKELSDSEIQTMFTDIPNYAYLKQSGSWNRASRAYKKQNGVWVEVESIQSLLDSSMKYV